MLSIYLLLNLAGCQYLLSYPFIPLSVVLDCISKSQWCQTVDSEKLYFSVISYPIKFKLYVVVTEDGLISHTVLFLFWHVFNFKGDDCHSGRRKMKVDKSCVLRTSSYPIEF